MDDKLLTTDQVAEILQVHKYTVLKYIKEGKLKGVKLGRVWRVRASDVERFIEEVTSGPKSKEGDSKADEAGPEDKDHYVI